jgi:hypothetical protein
MNDPAGQSDSGQAAREDSVWCCGDLEYASASGPAKNGIHSPIVIPSVFEIPNAKHDADPGAAAFHIACLGPDSSPTAAQGPYVTLNVGLELARAGQSAERARGAACRAGQRCRFAEPVERQTRSQRLERSGTRCGARAIFGRGVAKPAHEGAEKGAGFGVA